MPAGSNDASGAMGYSFVGSEAGLKDESMLVLNKNSGAAKHAAANSAAAEASAAEASRSTVD